MLPENFRACKIIFKILGDINICLHKTEITYNSLMISSKINVKERRNIIPDIYLGPQKFLING